MLFLIFSLYYILILLLIYFDVIADQSGVLVFIRLLLGRGESGHPHLLEILPDFNHWSLLLLTVLTLLVIVIDHVIVVVQCLNQVFCQH